MTPDESMEKQARDAARASREAGNRVERERLAAEARSRTSFEPLPRLPISQWSADKEAAALAGRNAQRPILNSVTTPRPTRLPQLTPAEIASGASVSTPGAPMLPGQVIVGGRVRTDNMPGTGSTRLPGYENPSSISYEGDNIVVRNEGAFTRPSPVESRISSAGLNPQSAAAQTVRVEEARTEMAIAKAKADQLRAQERAEQQAQRERERARKAAQQTGGQIAERLPSTISSRLSAIMGGQPQSSVRSRLPSFRDRK